MSDRLEHLGLSDCSKSKQGYLYQVAKKTSLPQHLLYANIGFIIFFYKQDPEK